jgi:hypothetical protein
MTPSRNRPPDSSCSDMADMARMAGDLAPGGTTDEPSLMTVVWPARYASGVSASRAQVSGTRRLDCQVRRRQVMTSETTPGASRTAPPERPVRCGTDSHADQPGLARMTAGPCARFVGDAATLGDQLPNVRRRRSSCVSLHAADRPGMWAISARYAGCSCWCCVRTAECVMVIRRGPGGTPGRSLTARTARHRGRPRTRTTGGRSGRGRAARPRGRAAGGRP